MNKETEKLYVELFDKWVSKFLPDEGDNRLEFEYILHKLLESVVEEQKAKDAEIVKKSTLICDSLLSKHKSVEALKSEIAKKL